MGRDALDERASVLPERPAPDPRAPRYVVRDHLINDANMLAAYTHTLEQVDRVRSCLL